MKKIIFSLLLLFTSLTNANTYSEQQMIGYMKKIVRDEAWVNKTIDSYGFTGEHRAVMKEHLYEIYRKDDVIKYMVKEMNNAGLLNEKNYDKNKSATSQGKEFGLTLIETAVTKGMSRMNAEDQKKYIEFMYLMTSSATPRECKLMVTANQQGLTSTEESFLMQRVMRRMNAEDVRGYLRLSRKALFSEINQTPLVREATKSEREFGEKAFSAVLEKNLLAHKNSQRLATAILDLERAPDADACEAIRLLFKSMLETRGLAGEWQIKSFINQLN